MLCHRYSHCVTSNSSLRIFPILSLAQKAKSMAIAAMLLIAFPCLPQDTTQPVPNPDSQPDQMEPATDSVTVPAGTRIALVLTYPIQSRSVHRGDDIYAQITSPVNAGAAIAIPPGTFVQGKVDKLEQRSGRAQLHLQSMAITFPDGYVAPVPGPVTMQSYEGYALRDPSKGHVAAAFALPMAGAGLGALIGHSVASSQPGTLTSSLPLGCSGPPPGCLTSSLSVPASKGPSTVIGAAVGGAVGAVASIVMLTSSHHFFLDVGSPVEMVLQQPMSLQRAQVDAAVRQSAEHPVATQPVAQRPVMQAPSPDMSSSDRGTCYTPETPGTPPTVIPGPVGPDGIPGPPTIIPGTPPIPGTPYPCP